MAARGQRYRCSECNRTFPRWQGRCPDCGAWDSLLSEEAPARGRKGGAAPSSAKAVPLSQIPADRFGFLTTGLGEFDRVTGGGLPKEGSVLLAGEPGIGKSTLMLQVLSQVASRSRKVLYAATEESPGSIKHRAERLGASGDNILLVSSTDAAVVAEAIRKEKPVATVVDSIQMLRGAEGAAPGSPAAVRDAASFLIEASAGCGGLVMVGHITKSGLIAGPKLLEHMVDALLYFEGEQGMGLRILRALKNRFVATDTVGVFMMREQGLVEIPDPASLLTDRYRKKRSGSALGAAVFGNRVFLLEVQALVGAESAGGPGARRFAGLDLNRMHMLIAVLEKRLSVHFATRDVYVNLAGGMKAAEPSLDLAAAAAILSSAADIALPADTIFVGEVGLSGEVRRVSRLEERMKEAARMGMGRAVVPAMVEIPAQFGRLSIIKVEDLGDLRRALMERKNKG